MEMFYPIIVAVFLILVFVILLMILSSFNKKGKKTEKQKGRQVIIREATKKLESDPHNPQGLLQLSDLFYRENNWEKAYPLYQTLVNVAAAHPEIDLSEAALRLGVCSIKLGKNQDALKTLLLARQQRPDNFEVNFYLGQALCLNNEFEKAAAALKKAIALNHEVAETYPFLAQALYKNKKYREALPYLKRTLDINPENKEYLFYMADSLNETGSVDKALKVFMHLRPDPVFGVQACLNSGIIHSNNNQVDKAIIDFEIGLKHSDSPKDIQVDLRYRLAQCYLKTSDISKGLFLLKDIQALKPGYKDVNNLVSRYEELNQNSNLRTYLIGGNSDFVALCRKIVMTFFTKARVKITDINVASEFTEVMTEIETDKWEDTVLFRFYRTTGSTGELFVRDFHGKIRDEKAGKGICFTAGIFTDEARKYIEGRPIDLIEKDQLAKVLKAVEVEPNYLQL
ncbi:MAG TPA: tetratricopeptide repeat protein [Treponemataceae bacterium]|jgi:tetratricopeptide (TPR) repeat protein|nr:tetratricopeptide repeat protein [Treponemataceae bacterium]HQL03990.1 tetratricopeptide repeat protein [Treponemataceae bacterium]